MTAIDPEQADLIAAWLIAQRDKGMDNEESTGPTPFGAWCEQAAQRIRSEFPINKCRRGLDCRPKNGKCEDGQGECE